MSSITINVSSNTSGSIDTAPVTASLSDAIKAEARRRLEAAQAAERAEAEAVAAKERIRAESMQAQILEEQIRARVHEETIRREAERAILEAAARKAAAEREAAIAAKKRLDVKLSVLFWKPLHARPQPNVKLQLLLKWNVYAAVVRLKFWKIL
jgi:hypothetical protein